MAGFSILCESASMTGAPRNICVPSTNPCCYGTLGAASSDPRRFRPTRVSRLATLDSFIHEAMATARRRIRFTGGIDGGEEDETPSVETRIRIRRGRRTDFTAVMHVLAASAVPVPPPD